MSVGTGYHRLVKHIIIGVSVTLLGKEADPVEERRISFKIDGAAVIDQSISFRLLSKLLDGIQNTFFCIGLALTEREAKSTGRIPNYIQQACELRRVIEKPGSYEVVAEVADLYQNNLFDFDLGKKTLDSFNILINSLSENDANTISTTFPDSIHRRRILRSVETYCPRVGDEWEIVFKDTLRQKSNILNINVRELIQQAVSPPDIEMMTVTGKLMRLHLDEHKIAIYYQPTGRILDCYYDIEIEDFIIGNLKDLIQVTGHVQLDASGHPEKIIDANSISELDLSPVKYTKLSNSEVSLDLKKPIVVDPVFVGEEIILEFPDFNIIATGSSREDAIAAFEEDFIWLWREYVLENDEQLSGDAIKFKEQLCSWVKE